MTAASPSTMPMAFLGHGSPMNAIEHNRFTQSWAEFGRSVPRPRAILMISAHWYINATAVTGMARPRTIHDFYGFPRELFEFDYPAPGLPDLAGEVAEVVKPTWVGTDADSWGIDHGAWSVLAHAFPDADIPIVQLSINGERDLDYHFDLGAQLAPLRESGVLIIGSGNIVHNLRAVDFSVPESGYAWAQRFDDAAREVMLTNPADYPTLAGHNDYAAAVPTPDHFLPSVYLAGLAAGTSDDSSTTVLVDGCSYGSLSMTSYVVD
ncbi:4,5-DOPA dioxygenase extradiol [Gordonia tangerina]|uniref:4,5-DOPA dioxygenase extradiol n=1 Tax=Gordonia tangerina TaxID=2911060 RepID=A0ABS9DK18_9ACTN|nr:4,5-DOPA dioxygenase extradiol [Gordonia tangerina]MCF3939575.1 4,5-DOPA dioxygenase extradiol [Gordonia tangerina]